LKVMLCFCSFSYMFIFHVIGNRIYLIYFNKKTL
jgi:hypothetical protein